MSNRCKTAGKMIEELLLYSGQFGLYYIIMQIIIEQGSFIVDFGHMGLAVTLLLQAYLLARFGGRTVFRLSFTFLVPVVYSILEYREGLIDLLNAAHFGFWFHALFSALLLTAKEKIGDRGKRIIDTFLVYLNIAIFLLLYFYFDTWKEVMENDLLTIGKIFHYLPNFLSDPTHWFIIAGGFLLATTIALGRNEVSRLKDRIVSLFGRYVDSSIRDAIIEKGAFTAVNRNLCILFSDIISFTTLCEKNSPSDIADMLNIYFEFWNGLVKKHRGIVDKYIGDAIMVIFGFEDEEEACNSAVACSLEALERWPELEKELKNRNLPVPEGFGAGCHFGELIIGDIGSDDRRNFTVIGDTVNTASRIESASRKTESKVIISSTAYDRLSESLKPSFQSIGRVSLKGKSNSVSIWGNRIPLSNF